MHIPNKRSRSGRLRRAPARIGRGGAVPKCKTEKLRDGRSVWYASQHLDLQNFPYVFMRWKEKCFINVGPDCGLTIAGFYYVCFSKLDGSGES